MPLKKGIHQAFRNGETPDLKKKNSHRLSHETKQMWSKDFFPNVEKLKFPQSMKHCFNNLMIIALCETKTLYITLTYNVLFI